MEQKYKEMYEMYTRLTIKELEDILLETKEREERAFFRTLLNMKLAVVQEKIIGERLL